jgi:CRISPR/Cas system-associated exonuclease Cas4 (RecB family)
MKKISFSTYQNFKECPRRYWYDVKVRELVGGWKGPRNADAEIGHRIHNAFYERVKNPSAEFDPEKIWREIVGDSEVFHGSKGLADFSTLEDYAKYLESVHGKLLMWKNEEHYIQKISKLLDGVYRMAESTKFDGFESEKWISFAVDSVEFRGIIDLTRPGEIIDLKTGARSERDIEQMKFYFLLYYRKHRIIPKAHLIYLMEEESEENPYTLQFEEDELEALEKDVLEVVNAIREGVNEPRSGDHCGYCPYRNICDKGK